jgi:hypothetical protein
MLKQLEKFKTNKHISQLGLQWFSLKFLTFYPTDLIIPSLFPMINGNIQAEWKIDREIITLMIDLKKHKAEWAQYNSEFDTEEDAVLNLDKQEDWNWIENRLRMSGLKNV